MSKRILLWSELFWPYIGGAEIFAAQMMCALRERGFDFAVITSHDYLELPDRDSYRGIPVYRFPFRAVLAPSRIDEALRLRREVAELVASLRPDLIHLNGVSPNAFFCLEAARRTGTPLLARLNSEPTDCETGRSRQSLLAQVLASASWTVAVSRSLLQMARAIEPSIEATSNVIYNGVEVPDERPAPPLVDPPLLLCVGRLVHAKGFDVAIDAFARVAETWPRARLCMVGEGPARADLQARAAACGVAARVEFRGSRPPDEALREFAAAALVLMPSRYEGLPSVALQAAAAGRAVVATRAGGLPEMVRDGETGVLAECDGEAFAVAIARVLRDAATAERMGADAWRRARREFRLQSCLDEYAGLYGKLLAGA